MWSNNRVVDVTSSPPFLRAQWDGVNDAASGSSPPEAALAFAFPRRRQVM